MRKGKPVSTVLELIQKATYVNQVIFQKTHPQKCCFIQNEQILQIQIDDKYVNSSVMVIEIMSC
jgi:hypothetical protein